MISAMRRSISAIACAICARRRSCVAVLSCRSSSVRASRSDSSACTCSGSRTVLAVPLARALALQLFHPLLNPRLRVDQSFASITHVVLLSASEHERLPSHYKIGSVAARPNTDPLAPFHPAVRDWFAAAFDAPTRPQALGWPAIARGDSTLILAPTGSGKTLDRVSLVPRSADVRAGAARSRAAAACSTSRRSRRWRSTSSATCARRSPASRRSPQRRGDAVPHAGDRHPHRRHAAAERARFQREPADILITTPESLYLLLTSNAREALRVGRHGHHRRDPRAGADQARRAPGAVARAARGALPTGRRSASACRRRSGRSTRSRGSSAASSRAAAVAAGRKQRHVAQSDAAPRRRPRPTPRSHDEFAAPRGAVRYRPVTIVDAGAEEGAEADDRSAGRGHGAADDGRRHPERPGVGRRRAAVDLVGDPPAAARADSRAPLDADLRQQPPARRAAGRRAQRAGRRDAGALASRLDRPRRSASRSKICSRPARCAALVATSSLELGIDMGAIDLVVQIEAPPSVASGLQRIGRGGHQVDAVSEGVIFPKFRGDLVACAAVARAMHDGAVEATRYPRNPLDVVAQQIVAMASMDDWDVDELFATIRRAAPFAELSRTVFDGVLDMLSGRYPSDEFAELRPRVTWDRVAGTIVAREGAKRVAIANGGTIPDRGLYGVFLRRRRPGRGARRRARRGDGVREPRRRDLRARRLVVADRGDHARPRARLAGAGRAGQDAVLERRSRRAAARARAGDRPADARPAAPAAGRGRRPADRATTISTPRAAENLLQYLAIRWPPPAPCPTPATIVIERVRDELGDWRVCVLSPRGGRIHAPWAMAVGGEDPRGNRRRRRDDVGRRRVRRPVSGCRAAAGPAAAAARSRRSAGAGGAAARRDGAVRGEVPRERRRARCCCRSGGPGMRAPLWQQRKRAADLLAVASRYGSFPVLLETYRECLRDFFDMPALVATLADIRSRKIRVVDGRFRDSRRRLRRRCSSATSPASSTTATRRWPSAARRRCRSTRRSCASCSATPSCASCSTPTRWTRSSGSCSASTRSTSVEERRRRARHAAVARRSRRGGDRARASISVDVAGSVDALVARAAGAAGPHRRRAALHRGRGRGALPRRARRAAAAGPARIAAGAGARSARRSGAALRAHARAVHRAPTSPPATASAPAAAEAVLLRLTGEGRLVEGEFRPGGTRARVDRRRRPAHAAPPLARQAAPRDRAGRSAGARPLRHHLAGRSSSGGTAPMRCSTRSSSCRARRCRRRSSRPRSCRRASTATIPADLDAVMAAGEVVWVGVEPLGERDGRIALYLADHLPRLLPPRRCRPGRVDAARPAAGAARAGPAQPSSPSRPRETAILDYLRAHGASFFGRCTRRPAAAFPARPSTRSGIWCGRG